MKINTMLSAAVGIFALSLMSANAQEKVKLMLKWEPGKTYVNKQTMNMKMSMNQGGQNMAISQTMTQTYTNSVTKAAEGNMVTMSFEDVAMKMEMNGAAMMDLDSKNPETLKGPEAAVVTEMLKVKVSALYGADGQIMKVEEPQGGGGMLDQFMDAETLKHMMKASNDYLPTKPIAVGEAWVATTILPMKQLGGDIKVVMDMKLNSVTGGMADIAYTGKMTMPEGNGNIDIESRKFDGTLLFDIKLGQIKKVTTDMDMSITAPGAAAGMPIKALTTVELTEVKGS